MAKEDREYWALAQVYCHATSTPGPLPSTPAGLDKFESRYLRVDEQGVLMLKATPTNGRYKVLYSGEVWWISTHAFLSMTTACLNKNHMKLENTIMECYFEEVEI